MHGKSALLIWDPGYGHWTFGLELRGDLSAIPALNKMPVLDLARCEWIDRRENVIALGPSGTGKTHISLGLGLAACQNGMSVGFTTATALVHALMEARDERRLLRLQKQMAGYKLVIIDELGFVPLSKTGAELLFEMISQRYERGATLITSNLPFDEWTDTFGSERLTGTLLDRLTMTRQLRGERARHGAGLNHPTHKPNQIGRLLLRPGGRVLRRR
jgi:DNA replication protein DnaC